MSAVIFNASVKPAVLFGLSKNVACPTIVAFDATVGTTVVGAFFLKRNVAPIAPAARNSKMMPASNAMRQALLREAGGGVNLGCDVCGVGRVG